MNPEQQTFYDRVFSEQGYKELVLDAQGGSGKTFTIQQILRRCPSMMVIAPTHKACSLFKKKNIHAQTIHRFLNADAEIDKETGEEFFTFKPKDKNVSVIVDECSMVSKDMYRALLETCKQIIFVGDRCQLPPIGESCSPVFDIPEIYTLQTNMRVGMNPDSISAYYLAKFREGVSKPNMRIRVDKKPMEFMLRYFRDHTDVVALAFTNLRVADLNHKIREFLFGSNNKKYYIDEKLVFSGYRTTGEVIGTRESEFGDQVEYLNYYSSDIIEICQLDKVSKFIRYQVDHCDHKDHSKRVLRCDECGITGRMARGHEITFYEITDQNGIKWYCPETGLNHLKDIIAAYKASCKKICSRKLWKEYIGFCNTYNPDLKYKYASTVHKYQGSQSKIVFVDIDNIRICRDQETRAKMEYTAASRYSGLLFFI